MDGFNASTFLRLADSLTLSTTELQLLLVALALLCVFLWNRMRVKYVYFIRHGETLLNKRHIKQGAEGGLSDLGIAQAKKVGTVFKDHGIEAIYTSPYERAVQTATLIQEELGKPVIETPLLAERRNASEVIGKPVDDPDVKRVMGLTAYGYHEDSYRYSDEENFEDLIARAKTCLRYLERRPAHKMLVVTHHAFLQILLSYLLYRKQLHASDYVKLAYFNPADNAGITLCAYYPWRALFSPTHGWKVVAYNEPTPPR